MIYKIHNKVTKLYSNGVILPNWRRGSKYYVVTFGKRGKEWTDEKLLKNHITKVLTKMKWNPDWEIVEVQYFPTKPIDEWVDGPMLLELMKK